MNGGYDDGYKAVPCFWGTEPSTLVKDYLFKNPSCAGLNVLDLGGGEGKNANAFALAGAQVTVVDISMLAIANGKAAFSHRCIQWINADAETIHLNETYDVIVSYGLFHCLSGEDAVRDTIARLKRHTRPGGTHLVCAFNARSQELELAHPGFAPLLLPHAWYRELYSDWIEVSCTDRDLHEAHPHNGIQHTHSMTRICAQKPND